MSNINSYNTSSNTIEISNSLLEISNSLLEISNSLLEISTSLLESSKSLFDVNNTSIREKIEDRQQDNTTCNEEQSLREVTNNTTCNEEWKELSIKLIQIAWLHHDIASPIRHHDDMDDFNQYFSERLNLKKSLTIVNLIDSLVGETVEQSMLSITKYFTGMDIESDVRICLLQQLSSEVVHQSVYKTQFDLVVNPEERDAYLLEARRLLQPLVHLCNAEREERCCSSSDASSSSCSSKRSSSNSESSSDSASSSDDTSETSSKVSDYMVIKIVDSKKINKSLSSSRSLETSSSDASSCYSECNNLIISTSIEAMLIPCIFNLINNLKTSNATYTSNNYVNRVVTLLMTTNRLILRDEMMHISLGVKIIRTLLRMNVLDMETVLDIIQTVSDVSYDVCKYINEDENIVTTMKHILIEMCNGNYVSLTDHECLKFIPAMFPSIDNFFRGSVTSYLTPRNEYLDNPLIE